MPEEYDPRLDEAPPSAAEIATLTGLGAASIAAPYTSQFTRAVHHLGSLESDKRLTSKLIRRLEDAADVARGTVTRFSDLPPGGEFTATGLNISPKGVKVFSPYVEVSSYTPPFTVAHELGHAQQGKSKARILLSGLLKSRFMKYAPAFGAAVADPDSVEGKYIVPGLGIARGVHTLGDEAGAWVRGRNILRRAGLPTKGLARSASGALLSYLPQMVAAGSIPLAIRAIKKRLAGGGGRAEEPLKEAARKLDGKYRFQGFPISIETAKGATRSGIDKDGREWSVKMNCDYGYIRGTEGYDGEHLDVFIGPHEDSISVFVVRQIHPDTKKFDEDKVLLGFKSQEKALKTYLGNYDRKDHVDGIREIPLDAFRAMIKVHKGKKLTDTDTIQKVAQFLLPGFRIVLAAENASAPRLSGGLKGTTGKKPKPPAMNLTQGSISVPGMRTGSTATDTNLMPKIRSDS
jgi:hypothetical protein